MYKSIKQNMNKTGSFCFFFWNAKAYYGCKRKTKFRVKQVLRFKCFYSCEINITFHNLSKFIQTRLYRNWNQGLTRESEVALCSAHAVVGIHRQVARHQATRGNPQSVIGQPGVALRVQDEEVGGVGHLLAGLVHPGDGCGWVGAHQSKEHQGEAGVRGVTVVGVNPQNLRLDWRDSQGSENGLLSLSQSVK